VKPFRWNPDKNGELLAERGVSFEQVVVAIEGGGLLDVLVHPNSKKYPNQRLLVVAWDGYADLVPYVEEAEYYFLKTVIPSRRPRETTASLENQMSRPDPHETEIIEAYELGKLKSVALRLNSVACGPRPEQRQSKIVGSTSVCQQATCRTFRSRPFKRACRTRH
jgi:hypothetical protein